MHQPVLFGLTCAVLISFGTAKHSTAITYSSSTTTHQNLQSLGPLTVSPYNWEIIRLEIVMVAGGGGQSITNITFNTSGTTNVADIVNARVYRNTTLTDPNFYNATTQFGATIASPSGNMSFTNAAVALVSGTNYFWLTYQIPAGATVGNFVDASLVSFTISSGTYPPAAPVPTVTAPAGNREIGTVNTLWIDNFENGCGSGCATYGTWSMNVSTTGWGASYCPYGGANGANSNRWYVSCAEDGKANTVCGTGCGTNESLHLGSVTLGDIGAAYDASWTTCKAAYSANINTSAAGTQQKFLEFEYIQYGEPGWDVAQLIWTVTGTFPGSFITLPTAPCCGACDGQNQGQWTFRRYTLTGGGWDNISTLRWGFNWANDNTAGTDPSFAINDMRMVYISPAAGLPVELLTFTGQPRNNYVELLWETASELNNDYFAIERSEDSKNFTSIGTVKGAGNSAQIRKYIFQDKDPLPHIAYYRLKQTDFDGKFSYSNVIAVNMKSKLPFEIISITRGTDNNYQALIQSSASTFVKLEIIDELGKVLSSWHFQPSGNLTFVSLNTKQLHKGMYLLKASEGLVIKTKKFNI